MASLPMQTNLCLLYELHLGTDRNFVADQDATRLKAAFTAFTISSWKPLESNKSSESSRALILDSIVPGEKAVKGEIQHPSGAKATTCS